jgi:hypothetical protein
MFESFDCSDGNPMHKCPIQVKERPPCRYTEDPRRFFLLVEWSAIEERARIRRVFADEIKPDFIVLIEGGPLGSSIGAGRAFHAERGALEGRALMECGVPAV